MRVSINRQEATEETSGFLVFDPVCMLGYVFNKGEAE